MYRSCIVLQNVRTIQWHGNGDAEGFLFNFGGFCVFWFCEGFFHGFSFLLGIGVFLRLDWGFFNCSILLWILIAGGKCLLMRLSNGNIYMKTDAQYALRN